MDWPIKPSLSHGLEPEHAAHLLERLLAIADDAVIVADAQQRIVLFNEGAERCFGYRAAEVLGQPLDLLIPPAHRERHAGHMQAFSTSPLAARRMGERQRPAGPARRRARCSTRKHRSRTSNSTAAPISPRSCAT